VCVSNIPAAFGGPGTTLGQCTSDFTADRMPVVTSSDDKTQSLGHGADRASIVTASSDKAASLWHAATDAVLGGFLHDGRSNPLLPAFWAAGSGQFDSAFCIPHACGPSLRSRRKDQTAEAFLPVLSNGARFYPGFPLLFSRNIWSNHRGDPNGSSRVSWGYQSDPRREWRGTYREEWGTYLFACRCDFASASNEGLAISNEQAIDATRVLMTFSVGVARELLRIVVV